MIAALLIDTYCIPCQRITGHEMNTVACEITCQDCNVTSPVSAHFVSSRLED